MKKNIFRFIMLLVILTFGLLFVAQLAGANADDPEQHRAVVFLPVVLQQCRIGQDCAVVDPTPAPECDLKNWWECP